MSDLSGSNNRQRILTFLEATAVSLVHREGLYYDAVSELVRHGRERLAFSEIPPAILTAALSPEHFDTPEYRAFKKELWGPLFVNLKQRARALRLACEDTEVLLRILQAQPPLDESEVESMRQRLSANDCRGLDSLGERVLRILSSPALYKDLIALSECLRDLTEDARDVVLRKASGMPFDEIGRLMNSLDEEQARGLYRAAIWRLSEQRSTSVTTKPPSCWDGEAMLVVFAHHIRGESFTMIAADLGRDEATLTHNYNAMIQSFPPGQFDLFVDTLRVLLAEPQQRLTSPQRDVIHHYLDGRSFSEIGDILRRYAGTEDHEAWARRMFGLAIKIMKSPFRFLV
jgi:hypothetical protein